MRTGRGVRPLASFLVSCAVSVVVFAAALGSRAVPARAQLSLTGEYGVRESASIAARTLGGATAAGEAGAFDLLLQPAAPGASQWGLLGQVEVDRFPLEGSELWSIAARVPLSALDPRYPDLVVAHRRLRADTTFALALGATAAVAFESDLTGVALRWPQAHGWSVGVALHVLETGGDRRVSVSNALGDSTVVTAGPDDLIFAGTVGVHRRVRWGDRRRRAQLDLGSAFRRFGEDTRQSPLVLDVRGSFPGLFERDFTLPEASSMASEFALGAAFVVGADDLEIEVRAEGAYPLYDRAPDEWFFRGGSSLHWAFAGTASIELAAGRIDDEFAGDWIVGGGVQIPLRQGWALSADLVREVRRHAFDTAPAHSTGLALRVSGPLGVTGDAAEDGGDATDDLDRLLDELDRMLEDDGNDSTGGGAQAR